MFELLSALLEEGMEHGEFRPGDPRSTAASIIAALTGLQYRAIGGVAEAPEAAARRLVEILLAGVRATADRDAFSVDGAVRQVEEGLRLLQWHARRGRSEPVGEESPSGRLRADDS